MSLLLAGDLRQSDVGCLVSYSAHRGILTGLGAEAVAGWVWLDIDREPVAVADDAIIWIDPSTITVEPDAEREAAFERGRREQIAHIRLQAAAAGWKTS